MTFAVPRRLGFLALVIGALPTLALSETPQSSASGRTWTDPPARGAAEVKPAPAPEAPSQAAAPAAAAEAKRPLQAAARTPKSVRGYTEARVRVTHRTASAPRHQAIRAVARAPAAPDRAGRRLVQRPAAYAARPPVIRYSYGVAPAATGMFVYEDDRARRIRQAQEAGYLVVRSRSIEFPDGRRLRTYRPYEEESDD
ncbi:hypothetical protein ASF49_18355 [Methylobacterium sp. Leaf104]|uniref:hypothetical protein n=1 Tax=Methylobacterium TaxID=407 RepID=UPI0006FFF311|nr:MULTISPECIES: hypothetical protein [Methylobacterium]KQP41327.1 hypothetical protein ASF49_18355 [Methylobacterium sp. Leaf104]MCI9879277.1 hypothetical protein [Methylobacterium goesingense]